MYMNVCKIYNYQFTCTEIIMIDEVHWLASNKPFIYYTN